MLCFLEIIKVANSMTSGFYFQNEDFYISDWATVSVVLKRTIFWKQGNKLKTVEMS